MIRSARLMIVAFLAATLLVSLAGCFSYKSDAPLVDLGGYGKPRVSPASIPPGPEHQICRDVVNQLQSDLDKCQKKLAKTEKERDDYKADRDKYKKQLDKLGG